MTGFWTVCKRELKGYFATPVAYVFLIIFLFFAGYLPFKERFFEARQADLRLFFQWLPILFVFMIPSTTMRLWSEERKSGSIELLFPSHYYITGRSWKIRGRMVFYRNCAVVNLSHANNGFLPGAA